MMFCSLNDRHPGQMGDCSISAHWTDEETEGPRPTCTRAALGACRPPCSLFRPWLLSLSEALETRVFVCQAL